MRKYIVPVLVVVLACLLIGLSSAATKVVLPTFSSPALPPPTPTWVVTCEANLPVILENYDSSATPTPTSTPRPTITPVPCTPVELSIHPYAYAEGGGEWMARVSYSCSANGFGQCYYYLNDSYLGFGVNYIDVPGLSCDDPWGPHTFGVWRECFDTEEWTWAQIVWRVYQPDPCP